MDIKNDSKDKDFINERKNVTMNKTRGFGIGSQQKYYTKYLVQTTRICFVSAHNFFLIKTLFE